MYSGRRGLAVSGGRWLSPGRPVVEFSSERSAGGLLGGCVRSVVDEGRNARFAIEDDFFTETLFKSNPKITVFT